jgi:hypothetical protein
MVVRSSGHSTQCSHWVGIVGKVRSLAAFVIWLIMTNGKCVHSSSTSRAWADNSILSIETQCPG